MSQSMGSNSIFVIQEETTFKTEPSAPNCEVLYFKDEGFGLNRNQIESQTISSNRNPKEPMLGNYDVSGSVSCELSAQHGLLIKHLIGTVVSTAYTTTAPGALTATASTDAGSVTAGTYLYKVTFYNADGETALGTVSVGAAVNGTTETSVALSAIPVPSATQIAEGIIGRKIYRDDGAAGGVFKLAGTIADNTTATFSDTLANAGLGATYSADPFAAPYTHVFKIGALPVGLFVEKGFTDLASGNKYLRYNGVRVNSGSFSFGSEGFIDTSFELMGCVETQAATPLDATPTDNGNSAFGAFMATLKEGGSTLGVGSNISISINNNLKGDSYVIGGAGQRYDIPVGRGAVSGKLTALFDSMALYTKATSAVETSLEVIISKGTGSGLASNEYIAFKIPELKFSPSAPKIAGDGGIVVDLDFIGFYDNSAEASAIVVTLKNTRASY